jgi:hypothetical protein
VPSRRVCRPPQRVCAMAKASDWFPAGHSIRHRAAGASQGGSRTSWTGGEVGEPGQETGANSHPFLWKPADYRLPGLPACLTELSTGPLAAAAAQGELAAACQAARGCFGQQICWLHCAFLAVPFKVIPTQSKQRARALPWTSSPGVATPPQLDDNGPGPLATRCGTQQRLAWRANSGNIPADLDNETAKTLD